MAAASEMPSMIFLYPVQRHTFAADGLFDLVLGGVGHVVDQPAPAITMPGMQKPHCTAPTAPNA